MLLSLCGLAMACTVTGQPSKAVETTTALQSPPRIIQVQVQQPTIAPKPRHRRAARNPQTRLYRRTLNQPEGCDVYNCIGPQTDFRLPTEIPYPQYEQQFTGRRSGR